MLEDHLDKEKEYEDLNVEDSSEVNADVIIGGVKVGVMEGVRTTTKGLKDGLYEVRLATSNEELRVGIRTLEQPKEGSNVVTSMRVRKMQKEKVLKGV